ncbi:lysophospholipase [Lactobacillus amylovorus]|uniref:alpha/beta hydrolase n=1 Tax=Lactobacillus amylovorus TaxID=1604 RepID=UPI00232CC599|nr:alpha/beta fold hydrolase [Lactobacillus amylovorus]MDB6235886.1 lysophospholipase [Lactobacillus amylovorus]
MNKNNTNSDSSVKTVKRNKTRESLPQKKYQVLEQDWNINQDGVNIYGRLYLPQNLPGKKKAVILSHGLAGNYRDVTKYAQYLAGQGYVAYAFDYPGGAKNGCSTGVGQLNMSIFTEEQNLKTVLNAVRNRSDVDRYQVSLLGESQGGAVSAMLASKYPKEVKSLILLYPAFSITDYAQVAFKSINRVPDTLNLFGFTVGKNYFAKLFNYDLLKSATKYNGPVLIMHGTDDIIVPETYSEKANKKFKHSKLYIFKHAGHDFKDKYVTRANRLITDFLKKN